MTAAAINTTSPPEAKLIDDEATFSAFPLDSRLLRALAKLNYVHPTLIQAKAVPLAMQGKDILARARTGSGKTLAYLLPTCHKILQAKAVSASQRKRAPAVITEKRQR